MRPSSRWIDRMAAWTYPLRFSILTLPLHGHGRSSLQYPALNVFGIIFQCLAQNGPSRSMTVMQPTA